MASLVTLYAAAKLHVLALSSRNYIFGGYFEDSRRRGEKIRRMIEIGARYFDESENYVFDEFLVRMYNPQHARQPMKLSWREISSAAQGRLQYAGV